jgi:hypothetical protein
MRAGADVGGSGGKSEDLLGQVLAQNGDDQLRQQPGSRQRRVGGWRIAEAAQALQSLERQFSTPYVKPLIV